jgi:hypothetical protein
VAKTRVTESIHFNYELDMLEAHVIEASKYADRIVVKEAARQWNGDPKPLYGKENYRRFKKYPKVEFMELPTDQFVVPETLKDIRINENLTRTLGWSDVSDGVDYVIECDVDEIIDVRLYPKLEALMGEMRYLHFSVKYHNFIWFMDWRSKWHEEYRVFKTGEPEICLRPKGRPRLSVGEIGWHFSGCVKGSEWRKKYTSMPQTYGFRKVQAEAIDWDDLRARRVRVSGHGEEMPLPGSQVENVSLLDYPEFIQRNPHLFPWSGEVPS